MSLILHKVACLTEKISDGYGRIATRDDEEDQLGMMIKNYILLYEDNEGDRMLVGDVPWEYDRDRYI